MELWASGFNAWGNLDFSRGEARVEPRDLKAFKCVLRDKSIRILRTRVSATLGKLNIVLLYFSFRIQRFQPSGVPQILDNFTRHVVGFLNCSFIHFALAVLFVMAVSSRCLIAF